MSYIFREICFSAVRPTGVRWRGIFGVETPHCGSTKTQPPLLTKYAGKSKHKTLTVADLGHWERGVS